MPDLTKRQKADRARKAEEEAAAAAKARAAKKKAALAALQAKRDAPKTPRQLVDDAVALLERGAERKDDRVLRRALRRVRPRSSGLARERGGARHARGPAGSAPRQGRYGRRSVCRRVQK